LVYAAWRGITLPILAVGSQMLIMPWLSNHYGMTGTTRFTNELTPLMLVAMSALAEGAWTKLRGLITQVPSPLFAGVMGTALVAISLWPLTSLFRYYDHAIARGETNAPAFAFFDDFMRQWKGDTVLLSDSPIGGKTVEYFLAVNGVPYDLMPLGRIMERLATGQVSGSATLILYDDDLARAGTQAELIAWDINAHKTGYGVYTISDATQVRKPSFVFSNATAAPAVRVVQVNLADQLGVLGYEVRPDKPAPGSEFVVNIHWQATAAMPEAYISFLHLIGPDGQLIDQDDHELGRGFYRTIFWQPGEVIREKYTLTLPKDAPVGDYSLRVGVYSFPSLQRLPVRSSNVPAQDNAITLGTLYIGP
jgi:hypothetical protein